MKKVKCAILFGVFDVIHEGHRSLFFQAQRYAKKLIIVVARDATVKLLKNKKPRHPEQKRIMELKRELGKGARVILGDTVMGKYIALRRYKPDVICVGYDQDMLAKDLRARMRANILTRIPIKRLKPYEPHRFHSSLS